MKVPTLLLLTKSSNSLSKQPSICYQCELNAPILVIPIWQSVLSFESQTAIANTLVEVNLAVLYEITVCIVYVRNKIWQILREDR